MSDVKDDIKQIRNLIGAPPTSFSITFWSDSFTADRIRRIIRYAETHFKKVTKYRVNYQWIANGKKDSQEFDTHEAAAKFVAILLDDYNYKLHTNVGIEPFEEMVE